MGKHLICNQQSLPPNEVFVIRQRFTLLFSPAVIGLCTTESYLLFFISFIYCSAPKHVPTHIPLPILFPIHPGLVYSIIFLSWVCDYYLQCLFYTKWYFLLQGKKFFKHNYWFASYRGSNYKFISPKWRKHQKMNKVLLISLYYTHKANAKS